MKDEERPRKVNITYFSLLFKVEQIIIEIDFRIRKK